MPGRRGKRRPVPKHIARLLHPDRIREFRREHNYTQRDLARMMEVAETTVSTWEQPLKSSRHTWPSGLHRKWLLWKMHGIDDGWQQEVEAAE